MRAGSVFDFLTRSRAPNILAVTTAMLLLAVMPVQADLQDPTRPPTVDGSISYVAPNKIKRPRWVLNSTLVSSQRRTAVINDRVVSIGDRINGARVMSIQPSSVTLRSNGADMTLIMIKKNIKTLSHVASSRQGK